MNATPPPDPEDETRAEGMSGKQIYDLMTTGSGAGSLYRAAYTAAEVAGRYADIETRLSRISIALGEEWTGSAADAASLALSPINKAMHDLQDTLHRFDRSTGNQSYQFDFSRGQLRDMPGERPGLSFWDGMTIWDTDTEDAVNKYNADEAENRRVYAEYQANSRVNRSELPPPIPNVLVRDLDFADGNGVVESVASVVGSVASITGNVGSAAGSVASVVASVASVVGNVGSPDGLQPFGTRGYADGYTPPPPVTDTTSTSAVTTTTTESHDGQSGQRSTGTAPITPATTSAGLTSNAPPARPAYPGSSDIHGRVGAHAAERPGTGNSGPHASASGGGGGRLGGAGPLGTGAQAGVLGAEPGRTASFGAGSTRGVAALGFAGGAMSGGPIGATTGRDQGAEDREHGTPEYLVTEEHGNEIVGPMPIASPPVLGG
ncbi:hypothetical protein [Saccharothrix luteola]|uniref:hypothetical protein n=1 Tax=Saccharothrix luteola TaxID=2893018 RepID=UPI001E29B830|nr:hypothetical protein [Saccharothrix luteola]MCC8244987.1 hypothetical protein [Saccharothrix luteola]